MSAYLITLVTNLIFAFFFKSLLVFFIKKFEKFRKIAPFTFLLTSPIITTSVFIILPLVDNTIIDILLFLAIEHILMLAQAYIFYLYTNEEITKCIKASLLINIIPFLLSLLGVLIIIIFRYAAPSSPPQPVYDDVWR